MLIAHNRKLSHTGSNICIIWQQDMSVLGAFSRPGLGHETGTVGLFNHRRRKVTEVYIIKGINVTLHHPQLRERGHSSAAGVFSTEGRCLRNVLTSTVAA